MGLKGGIVSIIHKDSNFLSPHAKTCFQCKLLKQHPNAAQAILRIYESIEKIDSIAGNLDLIVKSFFNMKRFGGKPFIPNDLLTINGNNTVLTRSEPFTKKFFLIFE